MTGLFSSVAVSNQEILDFLADRRCEISSDDIAGRVLWEVRPLAPKVGIVGLGHSLRAAVIDAMESNR